MSCRECYAACNRNSTFKASNGKMTRPSSVRSRTPALSNALTLRPARCVASQIDLLLSIIDIKSAKAASAIGMGSQGCSVASIGEFASPKLFQKLAAGQNCDRPDCPSARFKAYADVMLQIFLLGQHQKRL